MAISGLFYALLAYALLFHTNLIIKAIGVYSTEDKYESGLKEKDIAALLFAIVGLFIFSASVAQIVKYFADYPVYSSNMYMVNSTGAGLRTYINSTWPSLIASVHPVMANLHDLRNVW
jgi:hypothetical protein